MAEKVPMSEVKAWAKAQGIGGPVIRGNGQIYTSQGTYKMGEDGMPTGDPFSLTDGSGKPGTPKVPVEQQVAAAKAKQDAWFGNTTTSKTQDSTMGSIWNGKGKDFSDVSFLNGTSTDHDYSGTNVLDPNWPDGTTQETKPPDDGGTLPVDPAPTDPGDGPITPPDVQPTDPTDPGTTPTGPGDGPDYPTPDYDTPEPGSGGTGGDFLAGMDYTVPEAGDAFMPEGSGTADVEQTMWDVTPEQTVQGQFEDLYDRDSPIFELARQRAIRQHLASGGQNSAMAAGFGEIAAMDKAFQIAQADAATYARSAEFNAAMANQYSLAEQRFIHNALLSEQAFDQAKVLQTQRIAAQLESIVLDYKGRSALMDQELDIWYRQSAKQFEYDMSKLSFQLEGEKQMINMQALANFYSNGFSSVMQIAGNPNLTAKQSKAAMEEGMAWFNTQLNAFRAILFGNASQASAGPDFANYNWYTGTSGGTIPTDSNGYINWGDYSYGDPITKPPSPDY